MKKTLTCMFFFYIIFIHTTSNTHAFTPGQHFPMKIRKNEYTLRDSVGSPGNLELILQCDNAPRSMCFRILLEKSIPPNLYNKMTNREELSLNLEYINTIVGANDIKYVTAKLLSQINEDNIAEKHNNPNKDLLNNSSRSRNTGNEGYSTDMKFVYNPPLNGATGGLFCWTGKLVKKSGEYFLVYARNAIGEIFNESIGDNPFINKSSTEGIFAFKLNKEDRTPLFQGKTIRVCGKFSDTSELMNGRVVPILTEAIIR